MKYFSLALILLVSACASAVQPKPLPQEVSPPSNPLPTATLIPSPTPTETPPPLEFVTPNFVFQGDDPAQPIVTHQPSEQIKNLYINPGAVLFHQGKFHMFFNSFTSWPGVVKIGYMTSTDGYHWQLEQETPILVTDQIPFGQGKADISSMQVTDDGTWLMYFHTTSDGQIGMATAASPLGPWQVLPEPILTAGPQGSWDQYGLFWPSVVRTEDGYRMYYGGKFASGMAIGLAKSEDGLHWEKYDDPATTEKAYAESDPILKADMDWEFSKVDRPRVQYSPDGWVIIFQAGPIEQRGLALSNDGIHWKKYPENPIFTSEKFPIPGAKTWDTNLVYHDGVYYYFMELGTLDGTNIYLTAHQGQLRK